MFLFFLPEESAYTFCSGVRIINQIGTCKCTRVQCICFIHVLSLAQIFKLDLRIGRLRSNTFFFYAWHICHKESISKLIFLVSPCTRISSFPPCPVHRHNRPIFWLLEYIIRFANNPLFRLAFGWMMPPKHSVLNKIKKVIPSKRIQIFVLQDYIVPIGSVKTILDEAREHIRVYPIWLCPVRHLKAKDQEHYSKWGKDDILVDIGIYG